MTGGTVVVLGKTGRNFAAGMSGGVAYVYDEDGQFAQRCNTAQVALEPVLCASLQVAEGIALHADMADEKLLKALLQEHVQLTGSQRAQALLADWVNAKMRFIKVFPHEYRHALEQLSPATPAAAPAIAQAL